MDIDKKTIEEKEKINWVVVYVMICLLVIPLSISLLVMIEPRPPSPPEDYYFFFSVESNEESWTIKVDILRKNGDPAYIPPDDSMLIARRRENESYHIIDEIGLAEIKDTWWDDYGIIWNDEDGSGMFSEGDTIVILKEGGEEGRLLPGDRITIGFKESARSIELPENGKSREVFEHYDLEYSEGISNDEKDFIHIHLTNSIHEEEGGF